jgi:hypothetical protein
MSRRIAAHRHRIAVLAASAATAVTAGAFVSPAALAGTAAPAAPLTVRTVLRGADLGLTQPDDVTHLGNRLFVAFQNGVPSTGGAAGTPAQSTIVEFTPTGRVVDRREVTGKVDGLTADAAHQRLIATVNEDGNSSLYVLDSAGTHHYAYDANPLPHGGGTDAITVTDGRIHVVASAPAAGGPALYEVTLADGVAHLAAAPFYDSSTATVANAGSGGATVNLALTDPDSSTMVPAASPRFAGDFELTAQGDQQQIFASRLGTPSQTLRVLNLSQTVDDTAWATSARGALVVSDAAHDTVSVVTGRFAAGTAYTSVTPGNANNPGPHPGPNYLGAIDLASGQVAAMPTTGDPLQPKGMIFLLGQ